MVTINELAQLNNDQLHELAFFRITDVASFDNERITIKPIEEWTQMQKLAARVEYGADGKPISVECRYKLEALEILARQQLKGLKVNQSP
jgi:hypothetical protein